MAAKKAKKRAIGPSGKLTTADRKAAGLGRFEAWLPEDAREKLEALGRAHGSRKDWLIAAIDRDFEHLREK